MKLKVGDLGKVSLAIGSAIVSLIIGFRLMEVILFETEHITNGIMLIVLGTVLFSETILRGGRLGISEIGTSEIVVIVLGVMAYIIGVIEITYREPLHFVNITIPEPIFGAIGLLYVVLSFVMVAMVLFPARKKYI